MTQEVKKFDAEVSKILHLVIHSLYTNKEIFMRELISNASDACDKLRYLSQTSPALLGDDPEFKITVKIEKDKHNIIIRDNGIGMSRDDLIENLGTIARSGTQNFAEALSGSAKKDSMLIGQFGVGFYSSFMVADYVTVTSKKAGEDKTYVWHSDGLGEYQISDTDRDFTRGTEIIVHMKENEDSYLDHFKLKHIVKSYSDHIAVPIYFIDENGDNEVKLNSASALWTRSKSEVSPEQYQEFYKSISYSLDEPWLTMHNRNEGAVEFTNLLFIPNNKTFDLFHPDRKRRVKLYIKRVFISDENIDIIPQYLRFLRGVVDSEDLPLNISRETLQNNSTIEKIRNAITKRTLSELKKKKDESLETYVTFWDNFGSALKEGLCEAVADHEKLLEVCIFKSALNNKMTSLDDYIEKHPNQKVIYYLSGEDADKMLKHPEIEGFLSKNIDVLLFTDTVDDFWVNVNGNYKGYEIKSVTRSDIDLENISNNSQDKKEEPKAQTEEEYKELIAYFKEVLGDLVKDIKISKKLSSSMASLASAEGDIDIRMERFLIEQKQIAKSSAKILELNPKHLLIQKLNSDVKNGIKSEDNEKLAQLIFDQSCIIQGEPVYDAAAFAKRIDHLLQKTVYSLSK
jgi:molecular chaperone HtpG